MAKQKRKKSQISSSSILDTAYAFRESRVLLTAFELGIFTELGSQTRSASDVSASLRTNERATDRLMDALGAMGLLKKRNNKFSNTPAAARFLVKGKPGYLGGLMHTAHLWNTWTTLTDAVVAGTSVAQRTAARPGGMSWTEAFIAAMHMRASRTAEDLIKFIDLKGVRRVLDLGGGSGAYAMAFVRARKDIRAVIFDLPSVTPLTRTYISAEKLEEKIQTIDGDYTVDSFGHGFDLVLVSAIIHSNSADVNRLLMRKSFQALNPNGQLVIRDHVMNDDRTAPLAGTLFSLNMLVGTKEGDTFTEAEIRSWMQEAGFAKIKRKKLASGQGLMIGKRVAVGR